MMGAMGVNSQRTGTALTPTRNLSRLSVRNAAHLRHLLRIRGDSGDGGYDGGYALTLVVCCGEFVLR